MKVGIVGLPNVGKSTLFNAITNMKVLEANYPFATIEPNVGIVNVQDKRLNDISRFSQSKKIITTQIEFVDIAGLVENASKGEGLGNKFLGHIRNVNTLCHVVKCFQDPNIMHVIENNNPIKEIEIIETELILSDLEQIEKRLSKIIKTNKNKKDFELQKETEILNKLKNYLENEITISNLKFEKEELKIIKNFNLMTLKPMIYLGNFQEKDLKDLKNNLFFQEMESYSRKKNKKFIPVCILLEKKLSNLENKEKDFFLQKYNLKQNMLQEVIQKNYELLGLQTYFTSGPIETRAWSFIKGMTAPECAGIIHTDFQRGFIKAEVFNYQDLSQYQNLIKIKQNGKLRLEGKKYLVKDGDIIHFRFNV
ncbi:redox-regulated ATPase YchF [Candidatus Phytoplasma pini]|uniref:Ribosome-binding ATPase YchF n=1 Tax=Candidatus Phytoplasma pini TaxID=267362 RepID=A0A559KJ69_9MOLU|nr:redox-regulated ATPase YchF [Candidatus Phytoplasma pini]TVY12159.1 hypothetical protein MDPP_001556 [Candidatus Phytoplasma pini]